VIAGGRALASTVEIPSLLSVLAKTHAEFEQLDDARRCIGEADGGGVVRRKMGADVRRMACEID
jgi:hypothetical protein